MVYLVTQLLFSLLVLKTAQCFSTSGVPCYLHPSRDGCHYSQKIDSPACTSPKTRAKFENGVKQLNRSMYSLEQQLIRLGIIPPDNACSELPVVDNSGVVYSDLNLAPGCVGKYICNEGYFLKTFNGRREFNCTEDGIWDGNVTSAPITCLLEVDRCDLPSKINNGNIESDKVALLPGDLVTYTCEKGYELSGQGKRYCLRNGNWSDQQPECLKKNPDLVDAEAVSSSPGMVAGVSTSSVLLFLAVVVITVLVVLVIYRVRKQRKGIANDVRDSLTVSDEDFSPSHRVMSSGYANIDENEAKQKPQPSRKSGKSVYREKEFENSTL
ncbi:complement factor H-related protein 4-like [Halichondria panicea]|uniref:complement factor H-related protein 4-like n=1 Tax=Halichondria panicea TaxID=6063 RepID=UPI00312BC3BD